MKRIIQVTVLLIGILLVVVSAELTRRRDRHDDTGILLMTANDNGRDSVYLVGANSGNSAWRRIGPEYSSFTPKGTSPDDEWVYLMESNYNNPFNIPYAELMRVRMNGTHPQRLVGVNAPGPLFWSGGWIYYQVFDATLSQSEIYRATPDGRRIENLTANFQWSASIGQYSTPVIDPNGEWIVFYASDGTGLNAMVRLDLASGQFTEIIPQTVLYMMLVGATEDGAWILVQMNDTLYRLRPDGRDMTPIFRTSGGYVTLWTQAQLALVTVYPLDGSIWLYAVGLMDGRVYWKLPNVYVDNQPTSQPLLLLRDTENWLYQAEADGTPPRRLLQLPVNTLTVWQSPQGRWLLLSHNLYNDASPNSVTYILSILRPSDGAIIELRRSFNYTSVVGWAEDESAVFVEGYDNGMRDLWRIELPSGDKSLLLHDERYSYFLGVVGERKWGAWACVPIGGIGLIGAVVGSWVWGRRRGIKFPGYKANVGEMPTG